MLMDSCISYFFHCCDKIHDKKQLREGRVCFGLQAEDISCGKEAWLPACEAAGHAAPILINAHAQITFSFL